MCASWTSRIPPRPGWSATIGRPGNWWALVTDTGRPDGTPIPQVLENAQVCFGSDDEISARRMGPGEQYEGWVVLDMPVREGTLLYQPAGEPNGWEWEF